MSIIQAFVLPYRLVVYAFVIQQSDSDDLAVQFVVNSH